MIFWRSAKKVKILLHFGTWESMGNLKCGISQKQLIVERQAKILVLQSTYVGVLLMPDCFEFAFGSYGALFQNFQFHDF